MLSTDTIDIKQIKIKIQEMRSTTSEIKNKLDSGGLGEPGGRY